jgi:hypothetical protein
MEALVADDEPAEHFESLGATFVRRVLPVGSSRVPTEVLECLAGDGGA